MSKHLTPYCNLIGKVKYLFPGLCAESAHLFCSMAHLNEQGLSWLAQVWIFLWGGAFRALLNTAMKGWTKQLRLAVLWLHLHLFAFKLLTCSQNNKGEELQIVYGITDKCTGAFFHNYADKQSHSTLCSLAYSAIKFLLLFCSLDVLPLRRLSSLPQTEPLRYVSFLHFTYLCKMSVVS